LPVNNFIKKPVSVGNWVDEIECQGCKEKYEQFKPGITFAEAAQLVRNHNQETNGGFRSRGPVLWAMRILKLELWYQRHAYCNFNEIDTCPF
jgi:hypothetical protein